VARRLVARGQFPAGVKVEDFGIRGLHLAFEILNGYDLVILVDALGLGDAPGTITVLDVDTASEGGGIPDAHDMNPQNVLDLLTDLGGTLDRLLIVGCEPYSLDENMGLSEHLEAVVDDAVRVVQELIEEETAYAGKES
jgi:hydrogenase maturation protease